MSHKSPATSKLPTRHLTRPQGFRAVGGTCGIKASGKPDLTIIAADEPCASAGVFTRNKVLGAPVIIGKRHLRDGMLRAVVCNSGNSNVATGKQGVADAMSMCKGVANALGCRANEVVPCSTGIIGRPLPIDKILSGIQTLAAKLKRGPAADADAARAILTTDLVPKTATRTVTLGSTRVTLGGICKGSGMIAPNLATMLAFITTDAAIAPDVLQASLRQAVAGSFNRITVDTDTSTSDAVIVMASGKAGHRPINAATGKNFDAFTEALTDLCRDLAYQLVKDGEGATKVFRVNVLGAKSIKDADKVGKAVAESPLVKCAVHGADANWGRLAMAVGKSGAALNPLKMELFISGIPVYENAVPIPLTDSLEKRLEKSMAKPEVEFTINLNLGDARCEWLGCDLSREYIHINADYTT